MIAELISNYYIYGIRLKYDHTYEYRYVGLTTRGEVRFLEHLQESSRPSHACYNLPKSRWMRKHFYQVEYDILEHSSDLGMLKLLEMKWVHILKQRGHRLLNLTDGGDGTFGWNPSDEWRMAQSLRVSGQNNPMYGKVGALSPAYGKPRPEHLRLKLSVERSGEGNSFYGRKHTSKTLEAISSMKKGEGNEAAKLREADVRAIRTALSSGVKSSTLASQYGVSATSIYRIRDGKTWSHVK
jgi:group I intron endonuclease